MKTIIIKQLRLLNFKGVRNLSIDFDAAETNIFGRNGSGKTTVFDAFTWLLFGKDSQGCEQFDIKTLDTDGKIIYHLPHEVSATINVDGEDITLCRRLVEKFPKRNGVPTFEGNKVERYFNDVPCNEKEFVAKVNEICDESTFRKITSPTFFVSQKWAKQKEDLFRMAGEITDADIAAGNPEFETLLQTIGNKTIDEYKRELSAKYNRIKSRIENIPALIDENNRKIAQYTDDWAAIETEIKSATTEHDEIDSILTEINAASQRFIEYRSGIARKIADLQSALMKRRGEITDAAFADIRAHETELKRIDADIAAERQHVSRLERLITADRAALNDLTNRRSRMLSEYAELNKRAKSIAGETLQFSETDFVCPTCHRPFDIDGIESKQSEMSERFIADKKRRSAAVAAEIESNIAAGKRVAADIESTTANITASETELKSHNERIVTLTAERESKSAAPTTPDVEPIIAADADIIRIKNDIAALESKQNEPMPENGTNRDELKSKRAALNTRIDELKSRIAKRNVVNDSTARIAELETEYKQQSDAMTEIEGVFHVIDEFSKAKSVAIDNRINGLFKYIRFRWIKYRINGAEEETCEATINGVPYQSLNTAGRIIAGIDIINAICRFEGVHAPIFIDNAESLNIVPETDSQQIKLIVSNDDTLTIK